MNIHDAALGYLAKRPRTEYQLREYLNKKGFPGEEIDEVLKDLREMHYVDDLRFCKEYYAYGSSKGKSINLIKYELQGNGIDGFVIEDALAAMEEEENIDLQGEEARRALEMAENIARKNVGGDTSKLPGKIGRRLKGLGYDSDLIYRIVGKYMKEDHE
ncbi:MAG: regulatory protein RecX [Anaerovoracaceae bacterium]|jgi:regulatory protein